MKSKVNATRNSTLKKYERGWAFLCFPCSFLVGLAIGCGDSCVPDATLSLWQCPGWPSSAAAPMDGSALPCAGTYGPCAACTPSHENFVCQTGNVSTVAGGPSPGLGICHRGACTRCDEVGKAGKDACEATAVSAAIGPLCRWRPTGHKVGHDPRSGGAGLSAGPAGPAGPAAGECRLDTHPCSCQGINGDAPDYGCYGKGGAPRDMMCASNCGFARYCGDQDQERCEQAPCTWTPGPAPGAPGRCSACDCRCNGCELAGGRCASRTTTTRGACLGHLGGSWCECGGAPLSCAVARRNATCHAAAPRPGVAVSGRCRWNATVPNYVEETGACGECFGDAHCESGVCGGAPGGGAPGGGAPDGAGGAGGAGETYAYRCGACDRSGACGGRGDATHLGPGACACSCDAGFTGARCELRDCSSSLLGSRCTACTAAAAGAGAAEAGAEAGAGGGGKSPGALRGEDLRCRAADGDDVCFGNACGSRQLGCRIGQDIASCRGGHIKGNYTDLCYCECPDGRYGAYCELASPPAVPCAALATDDDGATPTAHFTLIAHNTNSRAIDVRLCEADTCHGNARGQRGQYQSCGAAHAARGGNVTIGLLPPRQTASLRLPTSAHFIIFIDKACGDEDAELYPPPHRQGWAGGAVVHFTVPPICSIAGSRGAAHKPLTCGTFGGCAAPAKTLIDRTCDGSPVPYPEHSFAPCNATQCCG